VLEESKVEGEPLFERFDCWLLCFPLAGALVGEQEILPRIQFSIALSVGLHLPPRGHSRAALLLSLLALMLALLSLRPSSNAERCSPVHQSFHRRFMRSQTLLAVATAFHDTMCRDVGACGPARRRDCRAGLGGIRKSGTFVSCGDFRHPPTSSAAAVDAEVCDGDDDGAAVDVVAAEQQRPLNFFVLVFDSNARAEQDGHAAIQRPH
jgi:hypothetical protein